MDLNHFFIIGAQRCATTFLCYLLDDHPQIYLAKPIYPEPKFFLNDDSLEKGKEFYLANYFQRLKNESVQGEKSASYIENTAAGRRIKRMFPKAKIIVLLRNPAHRAISNYYFTKSHGLEQRSIEDVFIKNIASNSDLNYENISVSPYNYMGRGEYLSYLKDYMKFFSSERFKVVVLEHFIADKHSTMQGIHDFLDVASNFVSERIHEKINFSCHAEAVNPDVFKKLDTYYRDFNRRLEDFLKIDLSIWDRNE